MQIHDAQQEVRTVFLGGSIGQAVSGVLWLVSAGLGEFASVQSGILSLALGGMLIFPLTQLVLKILGRQASLDRENPLNQLAMQIAFIIPLMLPVIAGATLYNVNWFYPAFMVVVGAHYLPFVFLYGMWQYAALSAALISGGVVIAMILPEMFTPGGWITGIVLVLFAIIIWRLARSEGVVR
ncbi:MAG: hypothetical protein P8074_09845 [Anaerolineales bacterium]